MLGEIFGGLIGAGASLGSSALSAHYQRDMLRMQDEMQRNFAKDSPSLQRQGLEKAGYNPMLAVNSAAATEPLGAQGPNVDVAGGIASGVNAAAAAKQAKTAEKQAESVVDVNKQNAENINNKTKMETLRTMSDLAVNSAKVRQIKADTKGQENRNKLDTPKADIVDYFYNSAKGSVKEFVKHPNPSWYDRMVDFFK